MEASKEFEGLVQHISGLEAAQREQEAKLAAEIAKHNITKAELQKVAKQEDRWKQKVSELQTTFASVKAALSGEERCNQQIKEEVRRLKVESNKIREAIKKDTEGMKLERETFLRMIEAANNELRALQTAAKTSDRSATTRSAPSSATKAQRREASAARTALREQVCQLEQALAQASNEKANLVLALEAAGTPSIEAPRGVIHSSMIGLPIEAMDEEMMQLKLKSEEYATLIEKHKALHNTTLGEYNELDKYVSSLATSLEELQSYCSNLERTRQPCNRCRSSELAGTEATSEDRDAFEDAMDMENPTVSQT